jgi:hypothetical protein
MAVVDLRTHKRRQIPRQYIQLTDINDAHQWWRWTFLVFSIVAYVSFISASYVLLWYRTSFMNAQIHDSRELLVWHREPFSKSVILKYDLLLVFQQQRCRWDTNGKCRYDNEGRPTVKNRHIEDELMLIFKNSHINDTQSRLLLSD